MRKYHVSLNNKPLKGRTNPKNIFPELTKDEKGMYLGPEDIMASFQKDLEKGISKITVDLTELEEPIVVKFHQKSTNENILENLLP